MRIPKKSTYRFVFVSNIKDPLAEPLNPRPELMDAFLLSETYTTPKTIGLTTLAKSNGSLIVSDNGNFSRMRTIAKKFQEKGNSIVASAQRDIDLKGKVAIETVKKRNKLISEITSFVQIEQQKIDVSQIIDRQLKCTPEYMIGMEDFTIPVLHMCSMLHPYFQPNPKEVRIFQKKTQQIYIGQEKGIYGFESELRQKLKFLVFHAYDYRSAKQAAVINRKINAQGIAISFGAPLASRNYISSIKIDKKTYKFNEPLPESYILSVALVLGVCCCNNTTLPVHILGVGTPILILLLGLLLRCSKAVSIDSTATFKDADDGNIYGSRDAFLKMDMYKVAAYALVNNDPYHSSSPWFSWFDAQYPSDWKTLQKKLMVKPSDDINTLSRKLKGNPKLLEKYIPFFTPMRSGNDIFIRKVRIARAGANFWVIKKICEEVRKRKSNASILNKWINSEVKRYEQFASPKWAMAVRTCFEIIKDNNEN
jgi:hypothetical protein